MKASDPRPLVALQEELGPPKDPDPVTDEEWAKLIGSLDRKRGLFRRESSAEAGWQFDPRITLWAIATRIGRFAPAPAGEVEYGVVATGDAKGDWIAPSGIHSYRLRASILTTASSELDPPDLNYPYDSSHDAPPPPVHELIGPLTKLVGPGRCRSPATPFTLCIRHDVDRPLIPDDLQAHLRLEDQLGLRSTWFFKADTYNEQTARTLIANDREIGYHAEILSTGDDGFVRKLAGLSGGPVGLSFHRGLGSEAFRGRRSLEDAHALEVAYAEFPVGMRSSPLLLPIGTSDWLRVSPLAVEPEVHPERTQQHIDLITPLHGMVVIENHPDLLPDRYPRLLRGLAEQDPACRTVGEAIDAFLPPDAHARPTFLLDSDP